MKNLDGAELLKSSLHTALHLVDGLKKESDTGWAQLMEASAEIDDLKEQLSIEKTQVRKLKELVAKAEVVNNKQKQELFTWMSCGETYYIKPSVADGVVKIKPKPSLSVRMGYFGDSTVFFETSSYNKEGVMSVSIGPELELLRTDMIDLLVGLGCDKNECTKCRSLAEMGKRAKHILTDLMLALKLVYPHAFS